MQNPAPKVSTKSSGAEVMAIPMAAVSGMAMTKRMVTTRYGPNRSIGQPSSSEARVPARACDDEHSPSDMVGEWTERQLSDQESNEAHREERTQRSIGKMEFPRDGRRDKCD